MSLFTLIPELLEKIGSIREEMNAKAEPLETSESGRDILAATVAMNATVARQLKLYSRALGTRNFVARIYLMHEVRKGKRAHWEQFDVQMAEPEFIPGGPAHLQALMDRALQNQSPDSKGIAFWAHAMPKPDNDAFFVYARHSDGTEAALVQNDGHWAELGLQPTAIQLTVASLLSPRESRIEPWRRLVKGWAEIVSSDVREDFTDYMKRHKGQELTDEAWEDFVQVVFCRESLLMFLHEVARATSGPLLFESQNLLQTLVGLIEKTLEEHNEKQTQMEKTHTRALTRFKTDLARERATKDVVSKRVKQLEREATELRNQLKQAGTGQIAPESQKSLGLVLDRFFT